MCFEQKRVFCLFRAVCVIIYQPGFPSQLVAAKRHLTSSMDRKLIPVVRKMRRTGVSRNTNDLCPTSLGRNQDVFWYLCLTCMIHDTCI